MAPGNAAQWSLLKSLNFVKGKFSQICCDHRFVLTKANSPLSRRQNGQSDNEFEEIDRCDFPQHRSSAHGKRGSP
jgi:hypothetical protein